MSRPPAARIRATRRRGSWCRFCGGDLNQAGCAEAIDATKPSEGLNPSRAGPRRGASATGEGIRAITRGSSPPPEELYLQLYSHTKAPHPPWHPHLPFRGSSSRTTRTHGSSSSACCSHFWMATQSVSAVWISPFRAAMDREGAQATKSCCHTHTTCKNRPGGSESKLVAWRIQLGTKANGEQHAFAY